MASAVRTPVLIPLVLFVLAVTALATSLVLPVRVSLH
jgi:hypothetical protein